MYIHSHCIKAIAPFLLDEHMMVTFCHVDCQLIFIGVTNPWALTHLQDVYSFNTQPQWQSRMTAMEEYNGYET